ncbi:MAG: STAS domain-containing protein [Brevinematia bacterium]
MKFEVIKLEDVTILKPTKSLTIFNVDDLSNPIPEITIETKGVILDLSETTEIDSFGVGIVVRLMSIVKAKNGKFSVVTKDNKVSFILKIDRLNTIIPLFNTIDEAINHLKD